MVVLRTPVALRGEQLKTVGEFEIAAGQTIPFVLTYAASHLPPPPRIDPAKALSETEAFWRRWAGRAPKARRWSEPIARSLLTLKSLTHRPVEVPWLGGYRGAKPVRVGNAAAQQLQIDVFGEVMDALHHGRRGQLAANADGWDLQCSLLEHLETIWKKPDHGIWEVRGEKRQFTHSKVMAWAAFDRASKTVEQCQMDGPVERWRALRSEIHEEVCRGGFNADVGAFTQAYGSRHLDASALLIPLIGFLPPEDPRVRSTVEAIQQLLTFDGLVMRYDTEARVNGLPPGEGVFLPCSFWLADTLFMLGRRKEAQKLFERLISLRNDVGLLSEEYDPRTKRLVGNFPPGAFSRGTSSIPRTGCSHSILTIGMMPGRSERRLRTVSYRNRTGSPRPAARNGLPFAPMSKPSISPAAEATISGIRRAPGPGKVTAEVAASRLNLPRVRCKPLTGVIKLS